MEKLRKCTVNPYSVIKRLINLNHASQLSTAKSISCCHIWFKFVTWNVMSVYSAWFVQLFVFPGAVITFYCLCDWPVLSAAWFPDLHLSPVPVSSTDPRTWQVAEVVAWWNESAFDWQTRLRMVSSTCAGWVRIRDENRRQISISEGRVDLCACTMSIFIKIRWQ